MPGVLEQMFAQQKQEKPSGMLDKLKNWMSPTSTGGKVGNRAMYNKYVLKAGEEGDDPVAGANATRCTIVGDGPREVELREGTDGLA